MAATVQAVLDSNHPAPPVRQTGMLLVLPVPFLEQDAQLWVESQAFNGLERWADNFQSLTVAAPVLPREGGDRHCAGMTWRSTQELSNPERFHFVPLPWAYDLPTFLACYGTVRKTLATHIAKARYLQFAIGGLVGDWAAIAALEARKQGRCYAIHTDRVEHEVLARTARNAGWKARIKARVVAPVMAAYHRHLIQHCTVGLWHGHDCYTAYQPCCTHSYLVHNIHTKRADAISPLALQEKVERTLQDPVLRICYAGRMDAMKAPLDWLRAMAQVRDAGVSLRAVWLGEGPLRLAMEQEIERLNLQMCVELVGFERDRHRLLAAIQQAHLMVFTHITPESPRCLIEALVCGTPIVGYDSHYAADLLQGYGGGKLVPTHDWLELARAVVQLAGDRPHLGQLIQQAASNGQRFNDEAVFQERSEWIKKHL